MCVTYKLILLILLTYSAYTDICKKHVMMAPVYICFFIAFIEAVFVSGKQEVSIIGIIPGGILFLFSELTKGAIGKGDAYLIGVTGLLAGFNNTVNILFAGLLLAAGFSIIKIMTGKMDKKDTIPFVPFILSGYMGVLLFA